MPGKPLSHLFGESFFPSTFNGGTTEEGRQAGCFLKAVTHFVLNQGGIGLNQGSVGLKQCGFGLKQGGFGLNQGALGVN